jgi:hypothetical protein
VLRRSHILTAVAVLAMCVVPGFAYGMPDQPVDPGRPAPPPWVDPPPEGQSYQDLRSPDARDAGQAAKAQIVQDLRSPDAREAAGNYAPEQLAGTYQDLRSPDARDAGRVSAPVQQPVVEIREVPSNGFDWGDAGIGAAGILAMFSIAAGVTLLLGSRRRRRGAEMPAH